MHDITSMTQSSGAAVVGRPTAAPPMLTGLFENTESLERAYQAVVKRGYDIGAINVVMSDETRERYHSEQHAVGVDLGDKALEGGQLGGPLGGTLGTLLPVVAAVGAFIAFPPSLLAAGPIAVALVGAGAAGVTAGLVGVFSDWGIPEERSHQYEAGIRGGDILMALKPRSDEDARLIEQDWKRVGGKLVHT